MDPNHKNFGLFSKGKNQKHWNYQPKSGSQPHNQNFRNLGTNQDFFDKLGKVGPGAGETGQSHFQQCTAADQTQGYNVYNNGTAINFFANAGGNINLGSLPEAPDLANNPNLTRNYSNPKNGFNKSAYESNQHQYQKGQTSQQKPNGSQPSGLPARTRNNIQGRAAQSATFTSSSDTSISGDD